MTFGISRGVAVDSSGNVQTNVYVEVRRMTPGYPLAVPIYADAEGAEVKSNPFFAAGGEFEFFAVGGLYRVRVYKAGFEKIWTNVPVGTAQAADVDAYATAGFTWAPESTTTAPPASGAIRFDNADVSLATHAYVSKEALSGSTVTDWLLGLAPGNKTVKNRLLLATSDSEEASWAVTAVSDETGYVDLTLDASSYAGPAGPISFGDSGFITLAREMSGSNGMARRGPWVTSTAYALDDGVSEGGAYYVCAEAHTSGTFATDLAAGKWQVVAEKGEQGDTGWAPRFAVVADGARRVLQLAGYVGGEGDAPTDHVGEYVGASGYTATIGDAVNVRGDDGPPGGDGNDGADGSDGADPGILLTWDVANDDSDPGTGKVKADNDALGSATMLYIDKANRAGSDIEAFLLALDDSTSTAKGALTLTDPVTGAQAGWTVTGVTDATGYVKVAVSGHFGAAAIADATPVSLQFTAKGDAGAGTGDVTAAANIANGALVVGDGGGKGIKAHASGAPGDAAFKNTGTSAGTVAAGDDSRITGAIQASLLTTRGDIIRRGASAPDRLALGAAGYALKSDGTDLLWAPSREVLTAARTYYVRTDGSDSNDGLTDNSGGAFLTIQKAVNAAMALDLSIYDVTIQLGAGTYSETVSMTGPRVGSGQIIISGDTTTPSNVKVNKISCYDHGEIEVKGLEIQNTDGIDCNNQSTVFLGTGMSFKTGRALQCRNGSAIIGVNASVLLASTVTQIANCIIRSFINLYSVGFTISGTPAWAAGGGIVVDSQSYIRLDTAVFTGSATGKRYAVGAQSLITTAGAGTSFIPGNSAGTVDSTNFGAYT